MTKQELKFSNQSSFLTTYFHAACKDDPSKAPVLARQLSKIFSILSNISLFITTVIMSIAMYQGLNFSPSAIFFIILTSGFYLLTHSLKSAQQVIHRALIDFERPEELCAENKTEHIEN
jgi:hypothetical protein